MAPTDRGSAKRTCQYQDHSSGLPFQQAAGAAENRSPSTAPAAPEPSLTLDALAVPGAAAPALSDRAHAVMKRSAVSTNEERFITPSWSRFDATHGGSRLLRKDDCAESRQDVLSILYHSSL